jgi:hypothetical protein
LALALESELLGQIKAEEMALLAVQDELYRRQAAGKVSSPDLNKYIEKVRVRVSGIDGIRITDAQGILIYGTGVNPAQSITG